MTESHSFAPECRKDASILILGSMPGRKSLEKNEYYALPQNAFWKIMGELFGAGISVPYNERLRILKASRIAIWDVLATCRRENSSLDSQISDESANDFEKFFQKHPHIAQVYFNGRKAEESFYKLVIGHQKIPAQIKFFRLPSTSPAHAGMRYQDKLHEWQAIICLR